MKIDVNPKILIWAREERGISPQDAATKLKMNLGDLNQWEVDGKDVLFKSLESIAKLYKRQTAVFFLPDVPQKTKKPKDFRNLAVTNGAFSPETMLAIRRTERYLQTARELQGVDYWNKQYSWLKDFSGRKDEIEKEIKTLKEILKVDIDGKSTQRSDAAFRKWRTKIEEQLGIFIFQFPMGQNEFDGFSYAFDEFPYAIVVNNQNAAVKKIFTIFHELVHIFRHDPGACKPDYQDNQIIVELECNNFAGKFLVPENLLERADDVDEIFRLAGNFNVSGEAYLRRLDEENRISKTEFFDLLHPVRERSNSFKKQKQSGAPSMIIQSKSTRGNKFFNIVTGAVTNNQISYSAASDLLGLKVGSIKP